MYKKFGMRRSSIQFVLLTSYMLCANVAGSLWPAGYSKAGWNFTFVVAGISSASVEAFNVLPRGKQNYLGALHAQ
jgi:hypothetical protein